MAVPGYGNSNPFAPPEEEAPSGGGGGRGFMDMIRGVGDRAAAQTRAMPNAQPAVPDVTVRKGAMKVGARPRPQAPPTPGAQYNMGDYDNGMGGIFGEAEQEGRGLTVDALGLARTAATGGAPSAAAILGQQGLDRAASEQQSLAASARGPAALAMAQQQAAYNTANMQQQGAGQMAAMRAQEMDQARQRYLEGTGLMRSQDQGRLGMEQQRGTAQAGMDQGYQQGQAEWYKNQALAGGQMQDRAIGLGRYGFESGRDQERAMSSSEQEYRDKVAAKNAADAKAYSEFYKGAGEKVFGAVNQAASSAGSSSNSATKAQSQAEESGAQDGAGATKSGGSGSGNK
jgi:hypothetical protein